ncbi:MAG TPA: alpha/beta hydrolase, partial [Chloroflexota bacterium]
MSESMTPEGTRQVESDPDIKLGYAPVNGLEMYYEVHGSGRPLVLLHGAFSAIGTSFGALLPALASGRQVIAVEFQGHGHTADIDRPLTMEGLVEDTVALLRYLDVGEADVFGYSMGGGIALALTISHPTMVRKLIYAGGASYSSKGFYPEILAGTQNITPDALIGSPFHDEYTRIAPNPNDFLTLVDKMKRMNAEIPSIPPDVLRSMTTPTLLINADGDIVRPEHVVEMFRLLGGGVLRFDGTVPQSQLAILPGTDHVTLMHRADLLLPIVD